MDAEKIILSSGDHEILLSISPDWPMIIITGLIGIGSIFTSILVGRISRQNQQTQNLAKKAELRQAWINELRQNISDLISIAAMIAVRKHLDDDFQNNESFYQYHSQLISVRTKIHLMLDPNKEYSKIIKSLIKDVYSESVKKDGTTKDLNVYRIALEEQSQKVLEKAWMDIKSELK